MRQRIPVYKLRLVQDRSVHLPLLNAEDPRQVIALFFHKLIGRAEREHLATLLFNRHGEPVGASIIGIGSMNHLTIPAEEVLKVALVANASGVVLSHNHPSSNLQPSPEDVVTTHHIWRVAGFLGIRVLDHLIVTPGAGFFSFAEHNLIQTSGPRANSYNSGAP